MALNGQVLLDERRLTKHILGATTKKEAASLAQSIIRSLKNSYDNGKHDKLFEIQQVLNIQPIDNEIPYRQ